MKLSIILHQKQLFAWIQWFSFMLPIMFLMVLNESLVLWSYWSVSFLIFAPNIEDSNQENKKIKCCCLAWLWKSLLSLFWLTWTKQERTKVSKEQKFFTLENNQSKPCSSERLNLFNKYFDQITYFHTWNAQSAWRLMFYAPNILIVNSASLSYLMMTLIDLLMVIGWWCL